MTHTHLFRFAIVLGIVAAWQASASADVILTTADGNGADAYIHQNSPSTNFGASGNLEVKRDTRENENWDRKTYLRFDISSLTVTVASAKLELEFAEPAGWNRTHALYGLNEKDGTETDIDDNWDESGLTWNNAPGHDNDSTVTDATFLGELQIVENQTGIVTYNQSAISDFLNADEDGLVTFILYRSDSGITVEKFHSKETTGEDAMAPTLTMTLIPEPASVLMLGLCGMLALRRRG